MLLSCICTRVYMHYIPRFTIEKNDLQIPLLLFLIISLHLIPNLEFEPILEAHAAFTTLFTFRDVFLDIFEGSEKSYNILSVYISLHQGYFKRKYGLETHTIKYLLAFSQHPDLGISRDYTVPHFASCDVPLLAAFDRN